MLFKSLATPIVWIFILLTIGLIFLSNLLKYKRLKWGWYCIFSATVILYVFSIDFGSSFLCYLLEVEYMNFKRQDIQQTDVIVILGGGVLPSNALREHAILVGDAWRRLSAGLEFFNLSNAKYLVLSGGPNLRGGESEAQVMRKWAIKLGVAPEKIIIETMSKNTLDQAKETKKLLSAEVEPVVGLVTSALHLKRATWSFKRYYKEVIPLPSDFEYVPPALTLQSIIPSSKALSACTDCLHEIIGYLCYRIKFTAKWYNTDEGC